MVWLVYRSNDNCTELFGIQEAESAGTVTSAAHSLKSPACSCVSITLPASLPAHVQKNIAFAGLMNSVHSVRYGCDFADVLCRFSSRVSCRGPDDLGQIFNLFSKLHAEKSEEYYCSGGNSRPSRPSGMGGGHFLVTPYDYSFHLVQLRFALKNSLKSPLCSCVSITLPAAS